MEDMRLATMPAMMASDRIVIPDAELQEQFVRASGPGGQNVNKVATAVELRFDLRRSPSLPADVRARLERLAGRRVNRATACSSFAPTGFAPRSRTAPTRASVFTTLFRKRRLCRSGGSRRV